MIFNRKRKNKEVPTWAYWLFFIGTGFVLLLCEDGYDGNEFYAIAILSYFLLLFLAIARWIFKQIKSTIQLRNEKKKTELMHLQSQVNPHFFFNMLNNLYGWVEKDPKKAKQLILNLSDLMRYSIYDGQKNWVQLNEEIQYLKNYVELHKMRYLKKIEVNFTIDIREENLQVMPLLFIILLENAFKHGVENLRENAFVHVHLSTRANRIDFSVENNFDPEIENKQVGIGLKNLRRRLELVYPKQHNLHLSIKENIHTAQLTIQLK